MKKETLVWTLIFASAFVYIAVRTYNGNMGQAFVKDKTTTAQVERPDGTTYENTVVTVINAKQIDADARFSWPRTIGLWVAAFFTLAIFSFLYRDNPFYKFAEATVVGVSAAYWMVIAFWSVIVPNLFGKIWLEFVQGWAMPGLKGETEYIYYVPLALGILLLCRLLPKGGWIARWPMAFFIGVFAGLRLVAFLDGDFVKQIGATIDDVQTLMPHNKTMAVAGIIKAGLIVICVLSGLVYFLFSVEHKGIVGKTAKVGIWFLMITFGAGFGFTVMGRIALLASRFEFLVDDWLWIIDPRMVRTVEAAVGG